MFMKALLIHFDSYARACLVDCRKKCNLFFSSSSILQNKMQFVSFLYQFVYDAIPCYVQHTHKPPRNNIGDNFVIRFCDEVIESVFLADDRISFQHPVLRTNAGSQV